MGDKTVYLETGSQDPRYNLAFEETVLERRREGDYLILWQNRDTVVIGQNQNPGEEVDRAFLKENGIDLVRRTTGGGAVFHDLGNLNYSFLCDQGKTPERFLALVVQALRDLGLEAEVSGRNDILASGRKVSGTAQRLLRGRLLHHGTLLFDADLEKAAGALRPDPLKFESRSVKSVRSRVGNIRPLLSKDMDLPLFWGCLKNALSGADLEEGQLSREELDAVLRRKQEKYDTWAWTEAAGPDYETVRRRKWSGGILECRYTVRNGRFAAIRFYGDFLSLVPVDGIETVLLDCPFRREAVASRLNGFDLRLHFGEIEETEILDTLFLDETGIDCAGMA